MDTVRWGILSTAKIGREKVIPALQQSAAGQVKAIASRDLPRAEAVAQQLGIARAWGSYEELLSDPQIDAIYNPLPNHLHVPWSIKALEAGKHVLCEKPIGLSAEEGRQLVAAGKRYPHLKLMEAFMYRHHPRWQRAREIVREGGIGPLRTIQSAFSYFNDAPNNIRNIAEVGGGGLMDIGCYPISLSRFIFDAEPIRVFGTVELDPRFQTDRLTSAVLDFGRGTSMFVCSTQLVPYQRVQILGEQGRLELEMPFNAPPDRPTLMWHQVGRDQIEELTFPTCDQYTVQGDRFNEAILQDAAVPTPIEDAVSNMLVIEAVVRSAKSGGWESVEGQSAG